MILPKNDKQQFKEGLITRIVADFKLLPDVEAIVLSGSSTFSQNFQSDVDLYIYSSRAIDTRIRTKIAKKYADRVEINNQFWETGDEWLERNSKTYFDLIYRTIQWVENQLERVLDKHLTSLGYTTCVWHNVYYSKILYDKKNWFSKLQKKYCHPFPIELKRNIIKKNFPVLHQNISSYTVQIEKAIARKDWVSINHRISAFLASYFDILFALNELHHPGEKRLIEIAIDKCLLLPKNFEHNLQDLSDYIGKNGSKTLKVLYSLIKNLKIELIKENLC